VDQGAAAGRRQRPPRLLRLRVAAGADRPPDVDGELVVIEAGLGDRSPLVVHLGHDVIPSKGSRLLSANAGHEAEDDVRVEPASTSFFLPAAFDLPFLLMRVHFPPGPKPSEMAPVQPLRSGPAAPRRPPTYDGAQRVRQPRSTAGDHIGRNVMRSWSTNLTVLLPCGCSE
jgi:hypothetical protein